jgi:glutathione synthase/RimK-type ligase-like ATP-grasp enzyme
MNQPSIAILSSASDFHSRAVAWGARESGASVTVLNPNRGIGTVGTAFALKNGRARILGLDPFSVIWDRRTNGDHSRSLVITEHAEFFERDRNTFQSNILECLETIEEVRWINKPSREQLAQNKLLQLTTALTVGLRTPDTVVTSDPEVVRNFLKGRSAIVVKSLQPDRGNYCDKTIRSAFSSVLEAKDFGELRDEDISAHAAIYQERIRKCADVRVVVFGQRASAFNLLRTKDPDIDSRLLGKPGTMKVEPITLTAREEARFCGLVNALGLDFATIDFAVDENGRYVFLDLNPSGEWLFLEALYPNAQLLPRFCSYLCFGDVEAGPAFPSLADYQRSSDYEALKRDVDNGKELPEYEQSHVTSENLATAPL